MQEVDDERLAEALHRPYVAFLEPKPNEKADGGPLFAPTMAASARGALYFCLTTATAFQISTTTLFCDGLVERGGLTEERRGDIELALHEAVANAILHGNLGLSSDTRDDFRQYETFCRLLEERLHDPIAKKTRVEIAATWADGILEVTVTDQGAGFADAAIPPKLAEKGLPMHGLGIIHSLALSVASGDDGRRLTLRFKA